MTIASANRFSIVMILMTRLMAARAFVTKGLQIQRGARTTTFSRIRNSNPSVPVLRFPATITTGRLYSSKQGTAAVNVQEQFSQLKRDAEETMELVQRNQQSAPTIAIVQRQVDDLEREQAEPGFWDESNQKRSATVTGLLSQSTQLLTRLTSRQDSQGDIQAALEMLSEMMNDASSSSSSSSSPEECELLLEELETTIELESMVIEMRKKEIVVREATLCAKKEVKESLESIFRGSHNGELIKTLKQSHRFVEEIFVK